MRKFKYKAWHEEKKKMYHVAKIDIWGDPDQTTCDLVSEDDEQLFNVYLHEVKLLQDTGLMDKAGKEIYEGYIVKVKTISYTDCSKEEVEDIWYHEGVMEFSQNGWCIVKKTDTGKSIKSLFFSNLKNEPDDPDTDIFEVVGNIFENPEMLGGV